MVNTGRPSRGCYLCRSRRVKCDEKKPGCGNCQRMKRQCPGYRPFFDVMHHNETNSTQHNTSPTITNTAALYKQKSCPNTRDLVEAISNGTHSIHPPLTAALEERAICFFLANYVLIPHGPVKHGFLAFLLPLIKLQPSAMLSDSLSAISLATFGNQPNAKTLKPKAEQAYSKALRQVTNAISDPKQAAEDTTLAAVLLLCLFENISDILMKENQGWNSWNSHMTGAIALLKMRNPRGPMSTMTLELVWGIKRHVSLSCLFNGKLLDFPQEWNTVLEDSKVEPKGGPAICNQLQAKVAKARVDCDELMTSARRTPQDIEKVLNLMKRAEAIEQGYLGWAEAMPAGFQYKSIGWIDAIPEEKLAGSKYFPGKIDKYNEVWTAHIWNMSRGSRLINHSTIVRCAAWLCSPQDYRTTVEYEKAMIAGKEMIRDVIASVPNCLSEIPTAMDEPSPSQYSFACGEQRSTHAKGLSAFSMLWPLFCVITSDFVTEAQRAWTLGRIKYATEELGVIQGSTMYTMQTLSVRVPSSMLEKDGRIIPSKIDNMLSQQIPVQQTFPVEETWTNDVFHHSTSSPTSTSSHEVKQQFSPGPQYDWTLLNPSTLDLNMINNWSHQTQPNWPRPNSGAKFITSAGPTQQTLASMSSHSDYPGEPQPGNRNHDWLADMLTC
ncbi:hypothetical protein SBOR_9266 [Sclerotinia borealis F-4128]|uniref:Zn(2)-C6 fungal-type domain-containing protein n=1 Tax=Sclerotinia borealis (strain F-4128) TaxID=1432307 RepID=W9C0N2_SCLBF|nr:hypothetical protein SBOR_9266 [Sclerotinia borealis F-4128]